MDFSHDSSSASWSIGPWRLLQRFTFVILSAALPVMAGISLHVPRVAFGGFSDSVFYLAYARHFGELVLRFGFPYYATRFGGILPDALSGSLFGEIGGIWILRYGLESAVSVALFLFFRKRYGVLSGLLASLFWSFNPAVLRLLCTTYVDSISVPFLILGCCLFASGWGKNIGAAFSGILVALAASAHLYAAFALLLLLPWFLASQWENRRQLFRALCWMIGGFLGTFIVGWIWYWIAWGMPALFSPTVEVMRALGSGGAAQWKKPLADALRETPAWFAPVVLLVPVAFSAIQGGTLLRGVALSLLASIGFFWGGDLFGSAYVLSMAFYYSFLLPVTILAGATLCGELLAAQKEHKTQQLLFLALMAAMVAPAILICYSTLSSAHSVAFCAAAILPLLPVWKALERRFLTLLAVLGVNMSMLLVASTGIFSWIVGHYPSDVPVLELASALRRELPKAADDGSVMRFWYDEDPAHPGGTDRRMIVSFWLQTFGKLTGDRDGYVPFPEMSAYDAAVISVSGVDRIVLLDQDPNQITKGLKVIRERGLPFQLSKRVTVSAQSDSFRKLDVAILDRVKIKGGYVYECLDLHRLRLDNGGKIGWRKDAAEITSGTVRWSDFVRLPLALKKGESIRIRFRIDQGMVRFSIHDDKDSLVVHEGKWKMANDQELVLTASRDLPDSSLSMDSMYPNGSRSRLLLEKVEKIAPSTQLSPL